MSSLLGLENYQYVSQSVVMPQRNTLTEVALLEYAKARRLPTSQVPKEGVASYTLPNPFDLSNPDNILVTASFGHIIPNSFLSHFEPDKRLNVHPSLLPRYRGAAPIQWTIANGDSTTGVSVQRLVEKGKGIDGGDIVGVARDVVSGQRRKRIEHSAE
jgi:methionyl-tRNA formyltransferase